MTTTNSLLSAGACCYFFLMFILVKKNSFLKQHPLLFLFRAFFPSWKFYEDCGTNPVLSFRWGDNPKNLGSWLTLPQPRRQWYSFFINPEGNLTHSANSLLQILLQEIEDTPQGEFTQYEESVSYKLLHQWVIYNLQQNIRFPLKANAPLSYQFKISDEVEDVLLSPIFQIS